MQWIHQIHLVRHLLIAWRPALLPSLLILLLLKFWGGSSHRATRYEPLRFYIFDELTSLNSEQGLFPPESGLVVRLWYGCLPRVQRGVCSSRCWSPLYPVFYGNYVELNQWRTQDFPNEGRQPLLFRPVKNEKKNWSGACVPDAPLDPPMWMICY